MRRRFGTRNEGYSRAKKVRADGYTFDSKMEYRRYQELLLLLKAGKISGLKVHPVFPIRIGSSMICKVELDFVYEQSIKENSGMYVYEDVKAFDNPVSKLKRKLVEASYGIEVTIIGKVK